MKPFWYAAAAVLSAAPNVHAASLAGAGTTMICAVVDLASCVPGNGCRRETADTINAPQLVTIDLKAQEITGHRPGGELLSTKIDRMTQRPNLLVLEGVQRELSWTITVAAPSGRMSLAAIGDGEAFAAFGSCETK